MAQANSIATLDTAQVRIGNRLFPFTSFEHVSAAYLETIARLDVGVSKTPRCEVIAPDGTLVAEVSYNGRVWAQGRDGFRDYGACLYDPTGGAQEFVEATLANRARFGGRAEIEFTPVPTLRTNRLAA